MRVFCCCLSALRVSNAQIAERGSLYFVHDQDINQDEQIAG